MKLVVNTFLGLAVFCSATSIVSAQALTPANHMQIIERAKVDESKRFAAYKMASMLEDRQFTAVMQKQLTGKSEALMLAPLLDEYSAMGMTAKIAADTLRATDNSIRKQKAIAADTGSVMEVRLHMPKNYIGKVDWKNLLVAYPRSGKNEWAPVEAFDRTGKSYRLDGRVEPSMPVLVVGINRSEAQRAGVALMNRHLQQMGLQTKAPVAKAMAGATPMAGVETTKLTRVRVNNDQEPWASGAAEMFAVVSGVQPDQAAATLTIVDLPYLDHDGKDYSPNQILIFWSQYRYAAANVQFFEHDDNTNYQQLAVALSQGVTTILGAFAPTYAVIGQVATAILQAMPAGWFANDDDYVDSFYTLEKGRSYYGHRGVAGNATISLTPYLLQQQ